MKRRCLLLGMTGALTWLGIGYGDFERAFYSMESGDESASDFPEIVWRRSLCLQEPGDIEAVFAEVGTKEVLKNILSLRDPAPFFFPKGLRLMRVRLMCRPQGVSVMERVEKGDESNESEQNEVAEVTLTPEEDSVVDTIQVDVDVIDPGVLLVGEMKENGSGESSLVGGGTENGDGIGKDIRL